MKKILFGLLLSVCAFEGYAQTAKKAVPAKKATTTVKKVTTTPKKVVKPAAQPLVLKNALDSASYAFGLGTANRMKQGGINSLSYELLVQGFKDEFAGNTPLLDPQKVETAINNLVNIGMKAKYAVPIAEGKAFLDNNKKQAGIQVTASGLQYQVLTKGAGISPKLTDTVLAHYKGTLLNGKQFDSSYDRNEPISFPVTGVIPGWTEGLQLMQVGAKYKFFIPHHLAYGETGGGTEIPPYSTLVFEVELLKVNGK